MNTTNESARGIVNSFLVALEYTARESPAEVAGHYFQDVAARVHVEIRGRAAHWRLGGKRISHIDLCDELIGHAQRRIDEHAAKTAKAKLTDAAPDLLAALIRLVYGHDNFDNMGPDLLASAIRDARAALAKAGVQS